MNLERLKADLNKFRLHFSNVDEKWWENFFQNSGHIDNAKPTWVLPLLKPQPKVRNVDAQKTAEQSKAEEELMRLITRKEREVEVLQL